MFKLFVLPIFFAAVSAGYIGAPLAYSAPAYHTAAYAAPAYAHAPLAYSAPIVKHIAPVAYAAPIVKHAVPVATSYANTYKVSVKAPVAYAAPIHAVHAPALVHAPAYHAPLAYAHAPLAVSHGYSPLYHH